MELLQQVGEFFLQAVPTVILVYFFYFFLKANLFKPLEKVLQERGARTEGARREADACQAQEQEKHRAYHEALKKARAEIYAEQEAARRAALEERAALVRDARNLSNEKVRAAKEVIARDLAAARAQLDRECQVLGVEIAKVILERRPPASLAGKEVQ